MNKIIEIIAGGVGIWSVFWVATMLIFRPELEPVFLIKFVEVIICIVVLVILGNKLWREIIEYGRKIE